MTRGMFHWATFASMISRPVALYLLAVSGAAASVWISGTTRPAWLVWGICTLALFGTMIHLTRRMFVLPGSPLRVAGIVTGLMASALLLAYLGFIVMGNIWELLRLRH